ncbi:MAG TPA: hypothetical protein VFG79_22465 [Solirubrobacter sp.]|nr:hypothetical protein [Solirubrobacter sp.]
MGRVLGLVGGLLALCIALLVLAVVLTRDEGNLQADSQLSERFTRAVTLAGQGDGTVDLRSVAPFEWDRVVLVASGTPRAAISRRLGQEWTGIDTVDGGDLLIFLRGRDVARFADYRGVGRFEGFSRPFAELPRVLQVRGLAITAR